MTGKRADMLLVLMDLIESFALALAWDDLTTNPSLCGIRPALDRAWHDLTDDEFFWEPFPTAWSVRPRGECVTPDPFGAGEWVVDFAIPEPTPIPMVTIAWLYWHIGSVPARFGGLDFLGGTRTMASGWTSPYLSHHPIFTSAAEAIRERRRDNRRRRLSSGLEAQLSRCSLTDRRGALFHS